MLCILALTLGGCRGEDSGAYDRGMQALASADYETAMGEFQKAANEDGRKAEAYRGEGIIYLRRQDYAHAVTLFSLSLQEMKFENQEFREDVLFYQAEAYQGIGQTQEAFSIYEELEEGVNGGQACFMRGRMYLLEGDKDQAEADFQRAVEKDGSYENYVRIYEAYSALNLEADGAVYLEEALKLSPSDAADYYQEGRVHYYLEEYDQAKASLNQAVDGGNQEAVMLLGHICLETGDTSGARALYRNYLEKNTRPAAAYNGLALCDIAEGNYDSALSNVKKGLECNDEEENENLLYNEIVIYEYKLDFDTAKGKMQEFLERYPGNEDAVRENKFLQSR